MKAIEVKQQIRLPFSRCVELVLSGVQFRLFRAGITVVIISLAGAFLMTMLSESLIARRVSQVLQEQTAPRKEFLFWNSRVSAELRPGPFGGTLADELAAMAPGSDRWKEFRTWGNLSDQELEKLSQVAQAQLQCTAFFSKLSEGQLRTLVGRAQGNEMFAALQDPAQLERFRTEVARLSGHRFPMTMEELDAFLKDLSDTQPLRDRILEGNKAAVQQIRRELLKDASPTRLLASADEALRQRLLAAGYQMPSESIPVVREQARLQIDAAQMERQLGRPVQRVKNPIEAPADTDSNKASDKPKELPLLKNLLARELDVGVATIGANDLFNYVLTPKGAEFFVYHTRSDELLGLDAQRVQDVARRTMEQTKLVDVESRVSQTAGSSGFMGFSNRTVSLLAVSFLVCIVGIINAMLMSVTERFQEIATMKCLGATDHFIMLNFILESMMQGVAGGIVGVLLGFLLGTLRAWASYGWMALSNFPLSVLGVAAAGALVISVLISAVAAMYPAWVAARLAPMEAMRIE